MNYFSAPKYLELKAIKIFDRSIEEHNEAWRDMVQHHCFRGNDTMMQALRFYCEGCSVEELDECRAEGETSSVFEYFITKYLEDNGYEFVISAADDISNTYPYHIGVRHVESGELYDDLLLNISW